MEIIANSVQTVATNGNAIFTDTVICGCPSIIHRNQSGLVTLRGIGSQSRARFKISFSGNIAIPATGTISPIGMAIAVDGEPIAYTNMLSTPAAASEFDNISTFVYIDVPKCCCSKISIINTSSQAIALENANLIVERVA